MYTALIYRAPLSLMEEPEEAELAEPRLLLEEFELELVVFSGSILAARAEQQGQQGRTPTKSAQAAMTFLLRM